MIVEKAKAVTEALQELRRLTGRMEGRVARIVVQAINDLRKSFSEATLSRTLEREGMPGLMRLIEPKLEKFSDDLKGATAAEGVKESLRSAYLQGVETGRTMLPRVIGLDARFDMTNARAVAFLSNYDFGLIREVTKETRLAIGEVVQRGFTEGFPPRVQAREIRDMIGLTRKQARAVTNFRAQLEGQTNSPDGRAMRAAHMRRLSAPERATAARQIREGGLKQKQINDLVEGYRQRLVNLRATTIARTETIRASTQGQQDIWDQLMDDGILDRSSRKRWLVAHDERLCPLCAAVPRLNPKGVPVGGMFQTEVGPVIGPPLHPSCRCTTSLIAL